MIKDALYAVTHGQDLSYDLASRLTRLNLALFKLLHDQ